MSGETESNISGWTVDTLHVHLQREIEDLAGRLNERQVAQKEAVAAAMTAQHTAMQTAHVAADQALKQRAEALDREFHEHLEQVRHENALALTNIDKQTDKALSAQKEAVDKAEKAAEKRFENVNEFRAQLADQAATFMPRTEAETRIVALSERTDAAVGRNSERIAELETRLNVQAGVVSGANGQRTELRLNIGALIGVAGFMLSVVVVGVTLVLALKP